MNLAEITRGTSRPYARGVQLALPALPARRAEAGCLVSWLASESLGRSSLAGKLASLDSHSEPASPGASQLATSKLLAKLAGA